MLIQQIFTEKIAHSSYILAGERTCAVIDPRRDIEIYLEMTRELGIRITHILETHLHADFISGHMDLAQRTGARIYGPRSANYEIEYIPLSEGDIFTIEDMELKVLETPGHTPEHISYVVTDTSRGKEPVALFCGDTMFVGDVGRPDLFPGRAEELASGLYDTLHDKLMGLPDFCEIHPAHGAGSLCGRAMASKRTSILGYEKKYNYALEIKDRAGFIEALTTNMPDAPDHFSRCTEINRKGPQMVKELTFPDALDNDRFKEKMKDSIILDVRSFESFGGQHIPQAYNIDLNSNFPTYAGWLLPPEKDILLVTDSYSQAFEACKQLHRVGHDRITGYLEGGMYGWVTDGLPTKHVPQISASELHTRITDGKEAIILDVRSASEYRDLHLEGAINIPVHELRERHSELDKELETILICGSGQRSSMGCSILLQKGANDVKNVSGGMTGYSAAGYGPECPMCVLPWAPFRNR
ncbi:MBL fold metallo-hydrolase [Methanolobus profundi]|uniref:Glyoxylase, beta-lactamase superfamily II n=1 Tax=Methanolobus profundi TaxID=487685 RepID=A0A1I4QN09_9EURY|nr:MBL fold metallo-hydrolase [Methanolobus profundi]SFM41414.1 Glyoxylase, beta-lactamase superfamily II [Methanolobus profundi]